MNQIFYDALESGPVIAAVKDNKGLEKCVNLPDIGVVFVLYGTICNLHEIVGRIKESGKLAVVHMDLIAGLGFKEEAVDYIASRTNADGIITTRPALVKRAKEMGISSVLRVFIIDSIALENARKQYENVRPDCVEVLPGVVPKAIRYLYENSHIPVIAGGLITDKEDVLTALNAGAIAVSATDQNVWMM